MSIKFRCFQCQRLLGVSSSKAGTVVACPKCGAELIVPGPDEPAGAEVPAGSDVEPDAGPTDLFRSLNFGEPAAPPADEVASSAFSFLQVDEPTSLRDEPIAARTPRVEEPTAAAPPAPPPRRPEPVAPATAPPPVRPTPPPAPSPPPRTAAAPPVERPAPAPAQVAVAVRPGPPLRFQTPEPEPVPELAFPPLQIEPEPIRPEPAPLLPPVRTEPPRSLSDVAPGLRRNDVVLPRTAVVLWSFFALLALVAAFAAGLLAGRLLASRGPVTIAVPAPTPAEVNQPGG